MPTCVRRLNSLRPFPQGIHQASRKAKLAEDLFGSSAKSTYEDMLDQELSKNLSGRVNLGIAEALVRQLGGGQ